MQQVVVVTTVDAGETVEQSFTDRLAPLVDSAFRMACAMLHDEQAAEDAVQEASIIAWRKFKKLSDPTALRPWFFKIVANECRNAGRRGWRSRVVLGLPSHLSVASIDESAVSRADLRQALLQLRHQDRLVVVLYYYFDLPLREIGAIAGISATAVRNRLYRSVRRLRPDLSVQEVLR